MKILNTEATFALTLPRELDGDEVSDLHHATGQMVELVSQTTVYGEDHSYTYVFGFCDGAAHSKEQRDGAYLAAIEFVESLGD